jgi:PAS domain S-box-containing protein
LLLVGTGLILRSLWRAEGLYRGQILALLVAVFAPWVGNVLYLTGNSPIPHLDLTPFAFTISLGSLAWGIFGYHLIDLTPVAHDLVVENMRDGMLVLDAKGRVVDINLAAARMINANPAQVIGQPVISVLHPWPQLVEQFRNVVDAIEEISFGEGAEQRWYELRLSPLLDRRNRFIGRVITIRNITDRKLAEQRQQSFLDDMKALQEIHLSLSEIDDLETLYVKIIELSQHHLGLDRVGLFLLDDARSQLLGTYGVDQFGHIRDERYYREAVTRDHWTLDVINASTHAKFWEDAPILDDGKVVGVGWKAAAALWNGHRAIGYLVCDSFITHKPARPYETELISVLGGTFGHLIERKRAETLLQESEARFRQIVESASDLIYRTDANGHFTYVNPTALRLMGFASDADMLGKHFLDMAPPDWRRRVQRFYYKQFLNREPNTYYEFPVLNTDGHVIWLGQNVQIVKEGEQVIGFQAVARDITELKHMQDALALARDQALEASRLKSQLLAKVSHELRTPLGGILGYAELLQMDAFGPVNAEQKQAAAQIIDSTHYLDTMINELLDEAQIEARTVILRLEPFSPASILKKVESSMAVLARNKGLGFTASLAPDVPEMLIGDEHRLQQILINLTGNAIKFTKAGQVDVSIYRPNPSHWAIKVSDTGAGISQEAQSYIFEPFRQVDNSITRENRGTGLGLSITKQLVELMDGQITVHSEVDMGSVFTVLLPIVDRLEKNE